MSDHHCFFIWHNLYLIERLQQRLFTIIWYTDIFGIICFCPTFSDLLIIFIKPILLPLPETKNFNIVIVDLSLKLIPTSTKSTSSIAVWKFSYTLKSFNFDTSIYLEIFIQPDHIYTWCRVLTFHVWSCGPSLIQIQCKVEGIKTITLA